MCELSVSRRLVSKIAGNEDRSPLSGTCRVHCPDKARRDSIIRQHRHSQPRPVRSDPTSYPLDARGVEPTTRLGASVKRCAATLKSGVARDVPLVIQLDEAEELRLQSERDEPTCWRTLEVDDLDRCSNRRPLLECSIDHRVRPEPSDGEAARSARVQGASRLS